MDSLLDPREHLPTYYQGVREIDILADALLYVFKHIESELQTILANNFAQTADEKGVARFEKMLGLVSDTSLDLETRRHQIITKMSQSTIFTQRVLEQNLHDICDFGQYTLTMDYQDFFADIKVRVGKKGMLDVLYDLLYMMLPAHVGFYIHNHLPASSSGGTSYALAVAIRKVHHITDAIAESKRTNLLVYPSGSTSVGIRTEALDALVDTLNSSLKEMPGLAVSASIKKQVTDAIDSKLSTQQTLTPAFAVAKARIVKN